MGRCGSKMQASHFNNFTLVEMKSLVRLKNKIEIKEMTE